MSDEEENGSGGGGRIEGWVNPACPWLPAISEIHDFTITRRHGGGKGAAFYVDALRYAQSHWMSGKPAQAVLQLDKAWMAELPGGDPVLADYPPPYGALRWILRRAAWGKCGYLGNPVRHFQHLASRMSGPQREIRAWRAWVCFHLAESVLPRGGFPRDGRQLAREGLWIPPQGRCLEEVRRHGWPGEVLWFRDGNAAGRGLSGEPGGIENASQVRP